MYSPLREGGVVKGELESSFRPPADVSTASYGGGCEKDLPLTLGMMKKR